MPISWSDALKEAYAAAPSDVVILDTLELRHPSFTQPIRVVRDYVDHVCTLEATAPANPGQAVNFIACPFSFDLPEMSETGRPEIVIAIDNVDKIITTEIEKAMTNPQKIGVTYRPYLSSDKSAPHVTPVWHMTLREVEVDVLRVTGRADFGDWINKKFPSVSYDATKFPGLIV